ncbi:MAG TPA: hypothetical protein VLK84_30450 [Longimicrobium sp.]|nr:hypothetical protein [Longimicrobium sp.]
MRTHLVLAGALALLAACSATTLPTDEWVHARASGEASLAVTNRGDEPIFVRVSDPTVLDVMVACTPRTCTRIVAGQTLRIPYAQIINYDTGDAQAVVSWWVFSDTGETRDTGTVIAEL